MNRTEFLKKTLIGGTAFMLPSMIASAQQAQEKPPAIALDIVKEFVGVSHGNIDRCKEMLENNHLLLHVSYDWGLKMKRGFA